MGLFNWGEFDGDLLNLILSNLFGKDRLSFGLVCRHWNAVAKNLPFSPCLVYYNRRTHTWKFNQHNTFFDTRFSELEDSEVRCSKHGWLLMSRHVDDSLFFFDPSNNQKVELPSVVGGELSTVFCFFNPPTSPECVVVGMSTNTQRVVEVCTLIRGQGEWENRTYQINHSGEYFELSLEPPVLHRGLIYFMSVWGWGSVAILDIKKQCLHAHFNCLNDQLPESEGGLINALYLVKVNGEDDELFGVFVFGDDDKVNVFRLSSDMKWESAEEVIGDKVLYISYKSCFGYKAPIKAMENTVCFPLFRGEVPVFYSLSDGKYHSIDGDYSEANAHGLKSFDFATWVLPMPPHEVTTELLWL